jgi:hypothetical protein
MPPDFVIPTNTVFPIKIPMSGGGGGGGAIDFNVVSTVGPAYNGQYLDLVEADATANAIAVTLPTANSVLPANGNVVVIKNTAASGDFLVTAALQGGDTIDGGGALTLAPGESAFLVSDGVSNFVDISASASGNTTTAVLSVSALRALSAPTTPLRSINLLGYYTKGDGAAGLFFWNAFSTSTDDGALVIKPNSVAAVNPGRWFRQYDVGAVNIKWFGAISDGTTHPLSDFYAALADAQAIYPFATSLTNETDWAAIQLAINTVASAISDPTQTANGGTVLFPKCVSIVNRTFGKPAGSSITLLGVGHGGVGTGNTNDGSSVIVYTQPGTDRIVDARSTNGFVLNQLSIVYSNPLYAGDCVDFSHFNGSDTQGGKVVDCCISGGLAVQTPSGARSLVFLGNAIECEVTSCLLAVGQSAIRFRDQDGSYSNAHQITNSRFVYHKRSLVNAGEAVQYSGCTFEGSAGVMEAAYFDEYTNVQAAAPRSFTFDPIAGTITASSGDFTTDGWVVGQAVTCFELLAGLNTGQFNVPLSNVAPLVLTLAGVTNMTAEVRNADCKLYGTSTVASVASPTSDATLGIQLTFAADGSITRDNGSWLDDYCIIGGGFSIRDSASNNGSFSPITAVSAKVLSFGEVALTFAGGGNTITRDNGDFTLDGWQIGQLVHVDGTVSNNGIYGAVSNVAANILTVTGAAFVAEVSMTADVYSLFETRFSSRTQASPGVVFTPEVSTTAYLYGAAGGGPMNFAGCWFGDQFLPSTWLQFGGVSALAISGCQFVGNLRMMSTGPAGCSGVNIGGNHVVTIQEPIYLGGTSSGIAVKGNALASSAADIFTGPGLSGSGSIDCTSNTPPATAVSADFSVLTVRSWIMNATQTPQILVPAAAGPALELSQNGNALFLGNDGAGQVQASGHLKISWLGGNTLINAFGFGFCDVGFPYLEPAGVPTSLLHCMGAFATVYATRDLDLDLGGADAAEAFKYSKIGIDTTLNTVTITLPDATICRGREYTIKSVLVGIGVATLGTFGGQTIDGVAGPIVLPAQWNWYHVTSDGTNWLVMGKG